LLVKSIDFIQQSLFVGIDWGNKIFLWQEKVNWRRIKMV